MIDKKTTVLFVCIHNAARSQMAEGIANSLFKDKLESKSAGTKPTALDPYAVKVMAEIGIDISWHKVKSLKDLKGEQFDFLVTLCKDDEDLCPFYPGAKETLHRTINDPPGINGTEEQKMSAYRLMRDEILGFIRQQFIAV
jgi:arsenate reductase